MKALFIGGTGTISSYAVELAIKKGWEITLLNRGNSPAPRGTSSIIADIHDEHAVIEALGDEVFDVVAQFIGFTSQDVERDIRIFKNHTKQYIYVSSASAYQKPSRNLFVTESTPLVNPYWQYSRNKIAAEDALIKAHREINFPFTVVRPSHTYGHKKVPCAVHGAHGSWQVLNRILQGKQVIIPGDGTSLWTLTHSADFAKGFVGLMANPHAIGHAVHITSDECMTWNGIYETIASALDMPLKPAHISSHFLAKCGTKYDFKGQLLGDKAVTSVFDNTKIKTLVPDFNCTISIATGLQSTVNYVKSHKELQTPDTEFDLWCDAIIAAQNSAIATTI